MSAIHVSIDAAAIPAERRIELEEAIEAALTFLTCAIEPADAIVEFLNRSDWMDLAHSLSTVKGI